MVVCPNKFTSLELFSAYKNPFKEISGLVCLNEYMLHKLFEYGNST